jgi:hypothetical protein
MQMHVGAGWSHLFFGANRYATLVHLFSRLDVASGDFVTNRDILGEHDFLAVNQVTVAWFDRSYDNQNVVVPMNSQQLSRLSFGLH